MGFVDDRIGSKKTILLSNLFLIIATIMVVSTNDESIFWVAGIIVGFWSGPNQSASRSLMSKLSPKNKQNEFFGFFAFSGKITAFLRSIFISSNNICSSTIL